MWFAMQSLLDVGPRERKRTDRWLRELRYLVDSGTRRQLVQREHRHAEHDRHVSHVEDSSSNRTEANIQEVDDAARCETIQEIRRSACEHKGETEQRTA